MHESRRLCEPTVKSRTVRHDSGFLQQPVPKSSSLASVMFSISPSVRLAKSRDGGVLLDIEHGAMFSLNPVGTRIVEILQQEQSHESLVLEISREFGVSESVVEADVLEFLSILRQQQLLNERATAQPSVGGGT
jgi:Coenzyme PQQ synthesis protein D (PqqD)